MTTADVMDALDQLDIEDVLDELVRLEDRAELLRALIRSRMQQDDGHRTRGDRAA